jgi:pectate lyase
MTTREGTAMPARTPRRKLRISLLAAVLATTAGVTAIAIPAAEAGVAPAAGGVYQLAVTKSGMCIDVPAGSLDNGALLQQWGCTPTATWQQFKVVSAGNGRYNLANVRSGRCVDVPSGSTTSGIQLQQWGCGDGTKTNQQWTFTPSGAGTYQIINVASGLCISDKGASTTAGAQIIQETCTANSNKQWAFNPVGNGGRTWSNTADGFAAGTTGGAGGTTVTVTNQADLVRYAAAGAAYVIRVNATITVSPYGMEIPVASNKTIIGVGTNGRIKNGGFFLGVGTRNVIIRNLTIGDTLMADDDPDDKTYDYDGIQMDTADHVWIDHNTITRTNDGIIDSRKDTTNLTISWNNLGVTNKAVGIGWTTNVTARMTIHHNWIHDTNQRNPSTDNVAYAHLYNNYLQNITSYGNYSRGATKMVLENSYFDNVNNPYYPDSTAQLRQSGSILVNSPGDRRTSGSAFTPSSFYSYTLDPAADVPALLRTYSGPQADIGG